MEFRSCARGRQWCSTLHYHWWTASIKPRLLFSHSGLVSWGLPFFSFNDSTKYWCDRNKKWKMAVKKMKPLFWLQWLHAPCLVSIGQNKLKLFRRNWISIFINSDFDHRHLGSNLKLRLDVSYPHTKIGVNMPKQTKLIERELNFYF